MRESSDFERESLGNYRYLFFVVADEYSLQSESLIPVKEIFAFGLGQHGAVISSHPSNLTANNEAVLSKDWLDDDRQQLENLESPKLLVIEKDFTNFDPSEDRFVIIDFADYGEDPQTVHRVLRQV